MVFLFQSAPSRGRIGLCRAINASSSRPPRCSISRGVMMRRRSRSDDVIRAAVQSAKSTAGALRLLGMTICGGNYQTIRKVIDELQLDTAHWTGQSHRKGSRVPSVAPWPLKTILKGDSTYHTNRLRERLIAEGVLKARCSGCFRTTWHGRRLPLELHHVDGNRSNNDLSNLRILCPNCHSLTHNWKGRATKGKSRS